MIDLSKFLQKTPQKVALGLNMITGSEFNGYIPPVIAVFVLTFIVTASRELGGISEKLTMIQEVKEDVGKFKTELKEDIGKVREEVKEVKADVKIDFGKVKEDVSKFKTELKEDIGKVREEVKIDFGKVREDLNFFKQGSFFILALGIGVALAQFYQARGLP